MNCSPGERSDTRDTGPAWCCAYAGYDIVERFSHPQDKVPYVSPDGRRP
jgi:hypothetical protein